MCLIVEDLWEREGKLGFWSEIGVILGAARLSGVKLGLFWSEDVHALLNERMRYKNKFNYKVSEICFWFLMLQVI